MTVIQQNKQHHKEKEHNGKANHSTTKEDAGTMKERISPRTIVLHSSKVNCNISHKTISTAAKGKEFYGPDDLPGTLFLVLIQIFIFVQLRRYHMTKDVTKVAITLSKMAITAREHKRHSKRSGSSMAFTSHVA
eukprot:8370920-Ditylum_brightwellii.AAC.1